jgi:hypothetical protein
VPLLDEPDIVPLDEPDMVPLEEDPVPDVSLEPVPELALWPVSPEVEPVPVGPVADPEAEDSVAPLSVCMPWLEPLDSVELEPVPVFIEPLADAPVSLEAEPLAVADGDEEPLALVSEDVELEPVAVGVWPVSPELVSCGEFFVPASAAASFAEDVEPVALAVVSDVEPVALAVPCGAPVSVLAVPEAVVLADAGAPCPGWPLWAVAESPLVWALEVRSDFELVAQAMPTASGRTSAILRISIFHLSM